MKTKKIIFVTGVFLLFLTIFFSLEKYALKKINLALQDLSPELQIKIGDLDLVMPGRIRISDIQVKLKNSSQKILLVKNVWISPRLSKLVQGTFATKILIQSPQVYYQSEIMKVVKEIEEKLKREKKEVKRPIEIQEIIVQDGTIDLREMLKAKQEVVITDFRAEARDIDLSKEEGTSPFTLEGIFQRSGDLKVQGVLKRSKSMPSWSLDLVLKSLELKGFNELLKNKIPLTFTKGQLDLFAEIKSQKKQAVGYVKPFFHDLDVIKQDENFKGPRHVLIEVLGALGNLILRSPKKDSVATKIPFEYSPGNLKIDTGKALEKVIEHGFGQRLKPGIEHLYEL
jgi:hypothetical protein